MRDEPVFQTEPVHFKLGESLLDSKLPNKKRCANANRNVTARGTQTNEQKTTKQRSKATIGHVAHTHTRIHTHAHTHTHTHTPKAQVERSRLHLKVVDSYGRRDVSVAKQLANIVVDQHSNFAFWR